MNPELIEQLLLESESAERHPPPEGYVDELWSKLESQLPARPDRSVAVQTDEVDHMVVLVDFTEPERDPRRRATWLGAASAAVVVVVLGIAAILARAEPPTTMVANDVADVWAAYVDSDRATAQTCAVSWMLNVDVHFGVPGPLFEGATDVPPFEIDRAAAQDWAAGAVAGVQLLELHGDVEFPRLRRELETILREVETEGLVDVASAIAAGRAELPPTAELQPPCPLDETSGSPVAVSLAAIRNNGVSGPNRAGRCVGTWLVEDALNNDTTAVVDDALTLLRSRYSDTQPPPELDRLSSSIDPAVLVDELRDRTRTEGCPI